MDSEKQKLIARPTQKFFFSPHVYNGVEYESFEAAMDARSEALKEAHITDLTNDEIARAEAALGKERSMVRAPLKAGHLKGMGMYSPAPPGSSQTHQDGTATLLTTLAWLVLISGVIIGLVLFSESDQGAYVFGAAIIVTSIFQFALLAGFARIIEYLRQIASQTRE